MLFGELPHLDNAAVPQERPFEGTAASQEQAAGDGFLFALYLFPELEDWLPLLRRLVALLPQEMCRHQRSI